MLREWIEPNSGYLYTGTKKEVTFKFLNISLQFGSAIHFLQVRKELHHVLSP